MRNYLTVERAPAVVKQRQSDRFDMLRITSEKPLPAKLSIRRFALASCLLFVLSFTSCSKSYQLETATVRGRVTVDGQPLKAGRIRFAPERGRGATGKIESDGTFILSTYASGDGATIGKHLVSIEARANDEHSTVEYEGPTPSSLIPDRYADETKSALEFEVKPDIVNQADFQLRSR